MLRKLALLAALALAGCSVSKDLAAVDQAIAAFHRSLDAGQFEPIYDASTQEIKGTTSKSGFVELLAAIHRKLGPFKSGKRETWNDNVGTGGHVVSITYGATYERGAAKEEFVYRIKGDRALLAGYHVTSNALIVN